MAEKSTYDGSLPRVAVEYIDAVVKKVRYRKKVRGEVRCELVDHFIEALSACDGDEEKERAAKEVIAEFGDVKILAGLIRRGKKRCRPLWKKVIIRSFQGVGILILITLARVVYLGAGVATVSVDYAAVLNTLDRQGKDESLNSKPYYDKAIELMVDVPESIKSVDDENVPIGEVSSEEVIAFLNDMAPAFDALREGSRKPYYWADYNFKDEVSSTAEFSSEVVATQLGSLGPYKRLVVSMSCYQIPWYLDKGDIDAALDDTIALIRFGRHMSGRGLLIEQLVGIAIEGCGLGVAVKLLDKEHLSAGYLALLQEELRASAEDDWPLSFEAEKIIWFDSIQRGFTDDGSGNGRVLLKGVPYVAGDYKNGFLFGYPDRKEFTESVESLFAETDNIIRAVPEQLKKGETDKLESPEFDEAGAMFKVAFPGFMKVGRLVWRMQTSSNAYVSVCAVLRYREEYQRFPESLEELVNSGLLGEVPVDPYSGKGMVYRKTDYGFVLYSVAENRTDDGGAISSERDSGHKFWRENADWVFWPVQVD